MASEPGFDANRFPETDKDTQHDIVTDTYEPGSTLKVVTVAGALSKGSSALDAVLAEPSIRVADRVIHEAHRTRTGYKPWPGPLALVQRRDDHPRRAARTQPARDVGRAVRLRQAQWRGLPG